MKKFLIRVECNAFVEAETQEEAEEQAEDAIMAEMDTGAYNLTIVEYEEEQA